jgi:hypothetical protein
MLATGSDVIPGIVLLPAEEPPACDDVAGPNRPRDSVNHVPTQSWTGPKVGAVGSNVTVDPSVALALAPAVAR